MTTRGLTEATAMRMRQPTMAVVLSFVHAGMAEYLLRSGFDAVVIDGRRGLSDVDVENVGRSCALANAPLRIRYPYDDATVQRYLALGASGFHFGGIDSLARAKAAIDSTKFAPIGQRGLGMYPATSFGLTQGAWPDYMRRANAETFLALSIENAGELAALPEVLALDPIDAVHIDLPDPKARERAISIALAAGKVAGIGIASPAEMLAGYEQGARYFIATLAEVLPNGLNELFGAKDELVKRG